MFEFSKKSKDLQEELKVFMDEHVYPNEENITSEIHSGNIWEPSNIIEDLKNKAKKKAYGIYFYQIVTKEQGCQT